MSDQQQFEEGVIEPAFTPFTATVMSAVLPGGDKIIKLTFYSATGQFVVFMPDSYARHIAEQLMANTTGIAIANTIPQNGLITP